MGKLDQLKKLKSQQQGSTLDLLQKTDDENLFDEEKLTETVEETAEEIKTETVEEAPKAVEAEVKPEPVKTVSEPKEEKNTKREKKAEKPEKKEDTEKKDEPVLQADTQIVRPVRKSKRHVVIPEGEKKAGTIRVPVSLYTQMEELIKDTNFTFTKFANGSIINCLNNGYEKMLKYNETTVVFKAKEEGFNLFDTAVKKEEYKVIPFNIEKEHYEQVIQIVSTHSDINSLNDFFINCLYTQIEKLK